MTWITIPGNENWEYDNGPSDPGGAQTPLWMKQFAGIRINTFDGTKTYTKTRRIGTNVETSGELNKTYYDNVFYNMYGYTPVFWDGLDWLNLVWLQ